MNKRLFCLMACLLLVFMGMAQNMKQVFISMPESIEPLLTKVNREDCVDFIDSNMKAVVKNRFDHDSELKVLTDNYLLLQLTDVSTLEMRLLPLADSIQVICMVKTVCGSACDSEVRFFDTQWKELDGKEYFRFPKEEQFYLPLDSIGREYSELRSKADMYLMKVALSSKEAELLVEYATPSYLNEEDSSKLSTYLRKEPIVYEWTEGRFKEK